jgi:hypothetical protein
MKSSRRNVFQVGELYSHEDIYSSLEVGNAGGIRPCLGKDGEVRRVVLMTSLPTAKVLRENPYHDRVEGDVLVYTAAGLEGRQEFSGINRRLLGQREIPYPIYAFCNIGSRRDAKLGQRRWKFLGLLQYLRHFFEKQIDARGQQRDSVVFELRIHDESRDVTVKHEQQLSASICAKDFDLNSRNGDEREVETRTGESSALAQAVDGTVAESTRRVLLSLPPVRFEHVVKKALEKTGFEQVAVTRYTGDGGIDVNATAGPNLWPYRGALVQVQAKRWLHTVGRREVAELRGSLQPNASGAIVTTSFYSRSAIQEATDGRKKPIVLINGLEFAAILVRNQCEVDND